MGSKQFTVKLTGPQRFDLWTFFYARNGYQPQTMELARNLQSVIDAFEIAEIVTRVAELADGDKIGPKDFTDAICTPGSVDLNNLLTYLDNVPKTVETALTMRLLPIAEALSNAKREPTVSE